MMERAEKIETVYRTLAWMEANPDKTITGTLATDAEGKKCRPYKPEATCFCFLGRLVVEAGPDERLTTNPALHRWFRELYMSPRVVSHLNDLHARPKDRVKNLRAFFDRTIGPRKMNHEKETIT